MSEECAVGGVVHEEIFGEDGGAPLALGVYAVAVVDEDFHSRVCVKACTFKLHKISR